MADDKKVIRDEIYNSSPSTAHLDAKGKYVPCETNQPLAYQNTSAHDLGQRRDKGVQPSYCEAHLTLGCVECSR